jgi:hypothetical protein
LLPHEMLPALAAAAALPLALAPAAATWHRRRRPLAPTLVGGLPKVMHPGAGVGTPRMSTECVKAPPARRAIAPVAACRRALA